VVVGHDACNIDELINKVLSKRVLFRKTALIDILFLLRDDTYILNQISRINMYNQDKGKKTGKFLDFIAE
jgi:hypothetical protein